MSGSGTDESVCRFVSHAGVLQQRNSYDCGVFVLLASQLLSDWVERGEPAEQGGIDRMLSAQCDQHAVTQLRQQMALTVQRMAAEAQQRKRTHKAATPRS